LIALRWHREDIEHLQD